MIRVALLDDYQQVALKLAPWQELAAQVEARAFHDNVQEPAKLAERLRDFDVVMALRERAPFSRDLMQRLPKLRLIASAGMRNAAIDVDAATELGILVCGTAGSLRSTTELTWGLIFAVTRGIPQARESLRKGIWQDFLGWGLDGKVLGLVGLGNIGAQMVPIAKALGVEVIAWSQNLKPERAAELGVKAVSKEELFRTADIVSIHLKLSERSVGTVGARELALMKPGAYLVNTSRGPLVDERALIDALKRGQIAGAGLDVFDQEPLPAGHPLLALDNVVALPHLGYVTEQVLTIFYRETLDNIRGYLSGDYKRVLNPEVLGKLRPRPQT
jgi:phosphoglycerate dehydrogenase-like enzyme